LNGDGDLVNRTTRQVLDHFSKAEQQRKEEESGVPPTLSESHLEFLDGIDEVPQKFLDEHPLLFTRHSQLTQIPDRMHMDKIMAITRATTRLLVFKREVTMSQKTEVDRFVYIQLLKSVKGRERGLLAPGLQEIRREEVISDMASRDAGQRTGLFGRFKGMLFGGGH